MSFILFISQYVLLSFIRSNKRKKHCMVREFYLCLKITFRPPILILYRLRRPSLLIVGLSMIYLRNDLEILQNVH